MKIPRCDIDGVGDDVYYYVRWRLKLEGENMGVMFEERKVTEESRKGQKEEKDPNSKGNRRMPRERWVAEGKVGFIENTAMRHRWGG